MQHKRLLQQLGFNPKENSTGIFYKKYASAAGYTIEVDFDLEKINYGKLITCDSKSTQNFSQLENWVILECVNRLLDKGYQPKNIKLEKTWATGHGTSGRLDVFVSHDDGSAYLMIECKTFGAEFDKEYKKLLSHGGQLFTYFQQDKHADVLMLYASELNNKNTLVYRNEIIKIEEDYRETSNVKDFYDRWSKLTKNNGIFDNWVKPYDFQSKALTPKNLKDITQDDSGFIFNQFLEILRHNVVSDKPNAFNKIFTLFLCKIYDEKTTKPTDELAFQWFYAPYKYEGISYPPDDNISFQKRLTDLYKKGMKAFLEKDVTDISDAEFEKKYAALDEKVRGLVLNELTEIRLKKNNEFAIKEVFDDDSFNENAKVVKEVVELLQGFKIRYTKKQQYLSDFFELLLTTGLKQESGQFFTPVPIAQFIIKSLPLEKIVEAKLNGGEKDNLLPTIIDYAAGSGHFITESMHEIQRIIDKTSPDAFIEGTAKKLKNWKEDHFDWALQYVYGIEKDYRLVKVGKVGCYLHGDGLAQVIHGDGLANFANATDYKGLLKKNDKDFPKENKQFDVLVSNPPYSVSAFKNNARKYYTEADFTLYEKLTDQSSEIECLFIERMQQLLKDGGLAGVILPSSILSNTGIYTATREMILQYFEIVAIAELGSNTFMATGTNTVVLFLRRRNNYDSINVRNSVEKAILNIKDVTLNGIEKAISQYVLYVWENITYSDYQTLLQRQPNKAILQHEIYQEYIKWTADKKLTEAAWWNKVITLETEKLFYFVMTYPQKLVLIKTGEKNNEKQFLGYEFSNRRGDEGIHPVQRGKAIDECTSLFDPEVFNNPEKASTYVYQAFSGDFNSPIHETLKNNVSRTNLVDLLSFDRSGFEKTISINSKKKIVSKWELKKLGSLCEIKIGATPSRNNYLYYENGTHPWVSISEMNGQELFDTKEKLTDLGVAKSSVKLIEKGTTLLSFKLSIGKVALAGVNLYTNEAIAGLAINPNYKTTLLDNYLFLIFKYRVIDLEKGGFNAFGKSLNSTFLKEEVDIPLPPISVQQNIIDEVNVLENHAKDIEAKIENLRAKIVNIAEAQNAKSVALNEVCIKITDGSHNPPKQTASDFPMLSAKNIVNNVINYDSPRWISKDDFDRENKRTNIKKYDVLMTIVGAIGRIAIVPEIFKIFTLQRSVAVLRADTTKINPYYLACALRMSKVQSQINQLAHGVAQKGLYLVDVKSVKIPLPLLEEQESIAYEISKIEIQISELEREREEVPLQQKAVLSNYLN